MKKSQEIVFSQILKSIYKVGTALSNKINQFGSFFKFITFNNKLLQIFKMFSIII